MPDEHNPVKHDPSGVRILVVDDDSIIFMAIKRTLKKMNMANPLFNAHDGVEALEILRGEVGDNLVIPPYIILLDINMPRMNGLEFLQEVRSDQSLRTAIIFVLTTSDAPKDICGAYEKNIAGYILKDDISNSFEATLNLIDSYSRTVTLPVA